MGAGLTHYLSHLSGYLEQTRHLVYRKLFSILITHQFNRQHQAATAHIADNTELFLQ
jgi:hypothetical protein